MIETFAYAFGVMYTPGPVNLLSLNSGLQGRLRQSLGFFTGVACAMLLLLLVFGLLGSQLVQGPLLSVVGALGCLYILYLALALVRAKPSLNAPDAGNGVTLDFRSGLVMQLLNPKGLVATLPIATIQFPAAGLEGLAILPWVAALTVLAFGAPSVYALLGDAVGRRIANPRYLVWFNRLMASLLLYVAVTIGYQHVYLPVFGH